MPLWTSAEVPAAVSSRLERLSSVVAPSLAWLEIDRIRARSSIYRARSAFPTTSILSQTALAFVVVWCGAEKTESGLRSIKGRLSCLSDDRPKPGAEPQRHL